MTGIFGCFSKDLNDKIINEIRDAIINEDYTIIRLIRNKSSILGEINNKSKISKNVEEINEEKFNIITCGEAYNNDITNLSEHILKLYKEGQLEKLKDINGFFAAAIYDFANDRLTIVNDRHGLIKLFYYYQGDHFCFAPKIKPILKICSTKSLKKEAIIDFFLFGYLLDDKTFFEEIHQLPPASILEFSKNNVKLTKYWDYRYINEFNNISSVELVDQLGDLWQNAVERRIKKDETIIIPLSGGLDSRAILAAALKCTSKERIVTFSFGEFGSYDLEIGKIVAKNAGVKNISLGIDDENFKNQYNLSMNDIEGMIDATPYLAVEKYRGIKGYGDTLFSGTKIDVLLGRHILSSVFSSEMLKKKIRSHEDYSEIKEIIFNRQKLNEEKRVTQLFDCDFLNEVDIKSSFERTHPNFIDVKDWKYPNYFAVWDYKYRWNGYIFFAVFRNKEFYNYLTMLDTDLVDFALKLPPEFRLDENLYKQMLIKKYPELFNLPTKTNFGLRLNAGIASLFFRRVTIILKNMMNIMSEKVINRNVFQNKESNYRNYNDLLRKNNEFQIFIRGYIDKAKRRDFFNAENIENFWRLHMQGKGNYVTVFGLLVTFEMMLERYFDE
jgi:asparagine synthase (glutamine-hydrolysing)